MNIIRTLTLICLSCIALSSNAQEKKLDQQIAGMKKEHNPEKSIVIMKRIIQDNKLDLNKDAETIDVMKGQVAMTALEARNYPLFQKYISLMSNKFNQTSYLNMAVSELVRKNIDLPVAERIAKQTLDLYYSYKDDPKAKPASYSQEDWNRFMNFAVYPYSEAYAMALHAVGKNKEALVYMEKSFSGKPEEGMVSSIELYTELLALNGQEEKAFALLTTMAKTGKSTLAMNAQLKTLYVKKNGSDAGFDAYFDSLQNNVQLELKKELIKKMQNNDAPGFILSDTEGKQVNLADFKGKIVVLDFWATWCMPCKASFPAMKKLMEKHPEVVFLYIATQEQEKGALARVKSYIAENKYPFHVLMDEPVAAGSKAFKVVSEYKPNGIPAKVVIDANGKQRFMTIGFSSDTELINEMEAMIALAKEQ